MDFKEKTNLSTKNSISGKVVLNSEGEIKTFPDKEKLKEFINTSVTQSCHTLCNPMECTMPGPLFLTNSRSLLKLMSIESVMPSNHLILCHPLLPPSIFPSTRTFANESVLCIRWPKYCSFGFSIRPSNEYSGLISFRMDWLDLLAVQGTLKSLLQIIVQKHQFFGAQLSLQSNSHIHT